MDPYPFFGLEVAIARRAIGGGIKKDRMGLFRHGGQRESFRRKEAQKRKRKRCAKSTQKNFFMHNFIAPFWQCKNDRTKDQLLQLLKVLIPAVFNFKERKKHGKIASALILCEASGIGHHSKLGE
jgi:hypothetical protein